MNRIVRIAAVELRRRFRNRSAIVTAFVAPLALAVVFGVLVGGGGTVHMTIGLADEDHSDLSRRVVETLYASVDGDTLELVPTDGGDDARRLVVSGDLDAALVVPSGFGAAVAGFGSAVAGGAVARLHVLRDPGHPIAAAAASSLAGEIAGSITARVLVTTALVEVGVRPGQLVDPPPIEITVSSPVIRPPSGQSLDPAAYFGASMSILFLFFTASFAAQSLTRARETGLVARQLAAGVSPQTMTLGIVLAVCIIGAGSFVTVWAATTAVFDARWGDPLAVAATIMATIIAVGGVAAFVAGFARTARQAESFASVVAFALALLGGNFIGPGNAPDLLDRLSTLTPNGQALRAFTAIATDGAGLADLVPRLALLVTMGSGFGAVGLARTTRTVIR